MACPPPGQDARMSTDRSIAPPVAGSRRPRTFQAAELALALIRRAEKQHLPGYRDTVKTRVRTGLRALDDLRGLWWGLSVIHGGGNSGSSDHFTLAARLALETSRGGVG